MQVSIETTSGLERRMTIGVPAEEVDKEVSSRLRRAAKTIRINGFRKGKVPMTVVKSRFAQGVRQEVVGELMNKTYYEALTQEELKPAGQPKIEATAMEEGKDLEFTAIFEVYPEIKLADFSQLKVEELVAEVTEDDIETMIETLRGQRKTWTEVKRASALEDKLNIDYLGTVEGEAFEGGQSKGSDLVLGSKTMINGFEDGLIGVSAEETVILDLTFPEHYSAKSHGKDLAGKAVKFEITINSISEAALPELDDEFFKLFGVTDGGNAAFCKDVRSNMERELKNATRARLKNDLMDALLLQNKIDTPAALVNNEIDVLRKQAVQQFAGGQQFDATKFDVTMLPAEMFKAQAEKRVAIGLLMAEVIQQGDIKADAEKVRSHIEELAATYEDPKQVVNWYYSNEEQLNAVENLVMEQQVVDNMLQSVQVTEKESSYQEAIRPASASAEEEPEEEQQSE